MALTFKFSLWHLFYATAAVGLLLGTWKICIQPGIDAGAFKHQPTIVETKVKRNKELIERLKQERQNAQRNDDS